MGRQNKHFEELVDVDKNILDKFCKKWIIIKSHMYLGMIIIMSAAYQATLKNQR